jgi:hypothetical protein
VKERSFFSKENVAIHQNVLLKKDHTRPDYMGGKPSFAAKNLTIECN